MLDWGTLYQDINAPHHTMDSVEDEGEYYDHDDELPTSITADLHMDPAVVDDSSFSPVGPPASSHDKLRAYEAKRRGAYESKLMSSSLYWQAFRTLMHDSLLETQKAESLLRGWTHASETYGAAMRCVGAFSVDERGAPVTDERKRKKILDALYTTHGGSDGSSRARSDALLCIAEEETCGSIIDRLSDSAMSISENYHGVAKFLSLDILPELSSLLNHLKSEIVFVEKLGDSILKELESAEEVVCKSWDNYHSTVMAAAAYDENNNIADVEEEETEPLDVWVAEMRYRMAVAFLSSVWEKCSTELSKLFLSMKDTECTRRSQLKDFMIKATEMQNELWQRLPSTIETIQKELSEWPMDRNRVENDVQASIRERAQAIQIEEAEHKKPSDGADTSPELSSVDDREGNFELSSPLVSDLLRKAKVVEKRGAMMMSGWKSALVILTKDSFLQVFELPANCKLQPGSAPEIAFQNLIPPIVVPSMDGVKSGVKFPSSRYWFDNLAPTESFSLRNCEVSLKEGKDRGQFEIVETSTSSGASKMFTNTTKRKLTFRTVGYEEATNFVNTLNQCKAKK